MAMSEGFVMADTHADAERMLEMLVVNASAGDRSAQNELLTRFWSVIRAAVYARMSEAVRVIGEDDIRQEVAIKVLTRLPTYRGHARSSFSAWVRAIVESVIMDSLRRERAMKRGRRDTDPMTKEIAAPRSCSIESGIQQARTLTEIHAGLQALDEAVRAPVLLHEMGYSYAEIAEIIGCTTEAARKRVGRAVEKLAQEVRRRTQ